MDGSDSLHNLDAVLMRFVAEIIFEHFCTQLLGHSDFSRKSSNFSNAHSAFFHTFLTRILFVCKHCNHKLVNKKQLYWHSTTHLTCICLVYHPLFPHIISVFGHKPSSFSMKMKIKLMNHIPTWMNKTKNQGHH